MIGNKRLILDTERLLISEGDAKILHESRTQSNNMATLTEGKTPSKPKKTMSVQEYIKIHAKKYDEAMKKLADA